MLVFEGEGVLNSLINSLPFELHYPTYNFLGPGTKLQKRLRRGDKGVNPLDDAAREHDIAYSKHKDLAERHKADEILENKAWERVKAKDASIGEKTAAWLTTTAMKAKRKFGMGVQKKSFKRNIISKIHRELKKAGPLATLNRAASVALKAARVAVQNAGGKNQVKLPRIIPVEAKSGGFLPLIPLFAGLSALGALSGGAAGIAKTVIDAKNAQKKLDEDHRHNKAMESLGKGLYLRKNAKGGFGLFVVKN